MSTAGLMVLVATLCAATAVGLVLRARSGSVRAASPVAPSGSSAPPAPSGWDLAGVAPDGTGQVLLLQLSSPVCAPCRQTATVLGGLAVDDPSLRHVEIDVAERTDVARALGVLRTPTTVAFDAGGTELARVSGVPRVDELLAAVHRPAEADR
ncbi:thiol-disulfide isomerase/thioredoxin [Pseudonocardia sediminis]|uniref:Thiol-disulfide isomerase/thioredoxin n=1 Tax=Pseudonocardia sediminis TaxID=1397368 RepID=A0A4Q7UPJ8_PSEST|nr:thioredoxin family protein [Pseudonocardia sediminis]RZT83642.1 thiol-disulfide isomerase/thioredoxin [Pseudonocardia sediminis]